MTGQQKPAQAPAADRPRRSSPRRGPAVATAVGLSSVLVILAWTLGTSPLGTTPTAGSQPAASTAPGRTAPAAPGATSSPSVTPAPAVTPGPGEAPKDVAADVMENFFTTSSELPTDAKNLTDTVGRLAGDAVLAEVAAELLELEANGWTREGSPKVASLEVVDSTPDGHPPTFTIEACIDSSEVTVFDSTGQPIGDDSGPDRAINIYNLEQQDDGSWIIVSHSFPNDPAC